MGDSERGLSRPRILCRLRAHSPAIQVELDVTNHGEHGSITDHIALLRTHPTGEQRLAVRARLATINPFLTSLLLTGTGKAPTPSN